MRSFSVTDGCFEVVTDGYRRIELQHDDLSAVEAFSAGVQQAPAEALGTVGQAHIVTLLRLRADLLASTSLSQLSLLAH